MALWDNNSESYKILLTATNLAGTPVTKYYTSGSECLIDSNYYRPRLKITSSINNVAPFFYATEFPRNTVNFQIFMGSTDLVFWRAKEIIQGSVKIYFAAADTILLSSATCVFLGRIPLNGISINKDILTCSAIDWIDAWEKIYPMSTKSVYQQNKIKGKIKIEKEQASIPIIFGQYNENIAACWDVGRTVTTEYSRTGSNSVIMPVKFELMFNSEYSALLNSMPSMFGGLEFSNVGVVDISTYGETAEANRTKTVIWKKQYGFNEWEICAFEGIERRAEGFNQRFTDGYNIEVGAWHEPAWHWYENNNYNILAIGNPQGWDYLYSINSREQNKRFFFVWHDTRSNRIRVSGMGKDGDMTWDGINVYTRTGVNWYGTYSTNAGTEIGVTTLSDFWIWKKNFAFRTGNGSIGNFIQRKSGVTYYIELAEFYSNTPKFQVLVSVTTNSAGDVGDFRWADGSNRYYSVLGIANNHSAFLLGEDYAYIYNNSVGNLQRIEDSAAADVYTTGGSAVGCCCYHDNTLTDSLKSYKHNYEHNNERLKNIVTRKGGANSIWVMRPNYDAGVPRYEWTRHTAANIVGANTYELLGLIISDQSPATSLDKFFYIFANNTANDAAYLLVYDHIVTGSTSREIALGFNKIYDVHVISRSDDNVSVVVATRDGIYIADAKELFFNTEAMAKAELPRTEDETVQDAFKLVSKEVMNTVTTAAKYSHYQYPHTEYVGKRINRPFSTLWGFWAAGLSRDDTGLDICWTGSDAKDNEIRLTTQASELDDLGWYGNSGTSNTEMTYWERLPMYLLWRAEGNTNLTMNALDKPDCVDWDSWEAGKALRDNYFTGNIRINIKDKDRVINHVWRLLRQMGHRMYADYSNGSYPRLKLQFAFDRLTPSKILNDTSIKDLNVSYYENYISMLRGQWNIIRGNVYSWAEKRLTTKYGGQKELDFPMNIYVDYDGGCYKALGGNTSWQTLFNFILAHESNYDAHDGTEDRPLRLLSGLVAPSHWNTTLLTCVTIDSTDYPEASGDYILYRKSMACKNMVQRWVLLEQSNLDYDGSDYAP